MDVITSSTFPAPCQASVLSQGLRAAATHPMDQAVHTVRQQAEVVAGRDHLHPWSIRCNAPATSSSARSMEMPPADGPDVCATAGEFAREGRSQVCARQT